MLQISQEAGLALLVTRGMSRDSFLGDLKTQLALRHQIIIIGETVKRLSNAFREEHQQVPWADIAGMRDRLVHEYDNVDTDLLWDVVEVDIPELIEFCARPCYRNRSNNHAHHCRTNEFLDLQAALQPVACRCGPPGQTHDYRHRRLRAGRLHQRTQQNCPRPGRHREQQPALHHHRQRANLQPGPGHLRQRGDDPLPGLQRRLHQPGVRPPQRQHCRRPVRHRNGRTGRATGHHRHRGGIRSLLSFGGRRHPALPGLRPRHQRVHCQRPRGHPLPGAERGTLHARH